MPEIRAIKRANEVVAECPCEGVCQWLQTNRGMMWLSCGFFAGLETRGDFLVVICNHGERSGDEKGKTKDSLRGLRQEDQQAVDLHTVFEEGIAEALAALK